MNHQLKFITPTTLDELLPHRKDVIFLNHFSPLNLSEEEAWNVSVASLCTLTFAYLDSILIGSFIMDINNKSVELHGIFRPDLEAITTDPKWIKKQIIGLILDTIFDDMGKQKVIIKGKPEYKGVKGFAWMWGFKRLQNMDEGRWVWVLTKQKHKERTQWVKAAGKLYQPSMTP